MIDARLVSARLAAARLAAALGAGLVFGLGLSLSGMLDPARVRGFLDVTGEWDSSLFFVLGGAVGVAALGHQIARRRPRPWLDARFQLPTKRAIDAPLLAGSALFGIGWGLSGLCPGPAIAASSIGASRLFAFTAAMVAGMLVYHVLRAQLSGQSYLS